MTNSESRKRHAEKAAEAHYWTQVDRARRAADAARTYGTRHDQDLAWSAAIHAENCRKAWQDLVAPEAYQAAKVDHARQAAASWVRQHRPTSTGQLRDDEV